MFAHVLDNDWNNSVNSFCALLAGQDFYKRKANKIHIFTKKMIE